MPPVPGVFSGKARERSVQHRNRFMTHIFSMPWMDVGVFVLGYFCFSSAAGHQGEHCYLLSCCALLGFGPGSFNLQELGRNIHLDRRL